MSNPPICWISSGVISSPLLQLEAALEYMGPEGGNVVLVKGDPGSAVAQRISQGYEAVAAEHPELNIVADQFHEAWSPDKALKTVENALSANNDDIQCWRNVPYHRRSRHG